ncbi:4310_t:CDS:2 [Cetraspora pellucida]|uniref:4310_t:CDS:1 n=1 Tax=Cetraspora pellucida TaxID=1433469 RepID=A0A9N9FZF2_9GLOM|nr:4310_t:CDS:2 [Cetraspora pellucida]
MKNDSELNKIVIRKPSKDVYNKCTLFKYALKESSNVNENLDDQFAIHIYSYYSMKEAYEYNIQIVKECDLCSMFFLLTLLTMLSCSMTLNGQKDGTIYHC